MKTRLLDTVGLIVLGVIALGTGLAKAQTTANGPYYATPSWDQTLPVATRFIVLSNMNNEAVLDRETGLVWQRTSGVTPQTFSVAQQLCHYVKTGNRGGWRLPSMHELRSLVDPSVVAPPPGVVALPAGHPFIVGLGYFASYWTGTTVAEYPTYAYVVGLGAGIGLSTFDKSSSIPFWCVRGGGPISVY